MKATRFTVQQDGLIDRGEKMTNRFKKVQPLQPQEDMEPIAVGSLDLSKGLVRNVSPRKIDLGATALMTDLRWERNGLRKDFGDRIIGGNAANKILCIVEHKFIDSSGDKFSRLIRLIRHTDGRAKTEIWNASTSLWEDDVITTTATILNKFVRGVSVRGVLLFACKGSGILVREESIIYSPEFDDFPTGNSLTALNESTEVNITPSDIVEMGEYTVYYDVDLVLASGTDLSITVGLFVDDIQIRSEKYEQAAPGSSAWPGETFVFNDLEIGDGDPVRLEIIDVSTGGLVARNASFSEIGGVPRWQATKSEAVEAYNDRYLYKYNIYVDPSEYPDGVDIGFYYDDGGGWVKDSEEHFSAGFNDDVETPINIDGMGAASEFGLSILGGEGEVDGILTEDEVTWFESSTGYTIDVHGHNLPLDSDPNHGIEYEAKSGENVTLDPIVGAPEATWLESFGDRIVAFQDGSDTQALTASADGTYDNWTTLDSVDSLLLDTRSDPIDDLKCAGPVASNILAMIRSRSIMKVFETGNYDLAVGVVHWIEGIGTESPHSIHVTLAGLMFLGHDYMVYILTEGGLNPVGQSIQQDLIEALTSNLDMVDGVYDPVYHEYWLGIPEDGANYMTKIFVFDVGTFVSSRGEVRRWRTKIINIERFGVASEAI